jgi:hypothetical protein
MEPLLCITSGPNQYLFNKCFLWYIGPFSVFPMLIYPVLNHYGYKTSTSKYRQMCQCPLTEEMSYCNVFDLVSMFLFYNNATVSANPATLVPPLFDLIVQYNGDNAALTEKAFYAHATGNFAFCENSV